jgi:ATP-dependent protease ClpP protease subunit
MAKIVALDPLPEVRLLDDITRESAASVIEQLSAYKGQRVALSIFSNGGDVHGGNALASYISDPANRFQVEARVYGNAASAAMIVCAACQKAYISSGSFALIHKAHAVGADGKVIPEDKLPDNERDTLASMNASQVDLFSSRSGKAKSTVERLMNEDRNMTAEEAADFGLFDGIIPQALRLAALKQTPMAEEKKYVSFKVPASAALAAITSGEIKVSEDLVTGLEAAKVTELDKQILALTTERDDLKAKAEAAEKAKTEAEEAKVALEAKSAADIKAVQDENTTYKATLKKLSENPLVAQVLENGAGVVIPGVMPGVDPNKPEPTRREKEAAEGMKAWQEARKIYFNAQ